MGVFLSICLGFIRKEKLPQLEVVVPVDRAAVFEVECEESDESDDSLMSVQSEPADIPVYSFPEMRRCISAY